MDSSPDFPISRLANARARSRILSHHTVSLKVFHFIYKWLYERSQRRDSFKLPGNDRGKMGLGFGDYIMGQSKIGSLGAYDLLNRRKKRFKWAIGAVFVAIAIWLLIELIYAINFYGA